MMKYRWCIFTLIVVLCSSCVEIEQEIWVYANGSGRVRVAFGISKAMYKVMNFKSQKDREEALKKDKDLLEKNPNVAKAEVTEYEKKDLWFYSIDVQINDLSNTKQLQKDLQQIFSTKGKRPGRNTNIRVKKLDNGNYLFVYEFEKKDEEISQFDKSINKLFAGKHFLFRLHAPHIVSSNGYRNREKNSVEWRFRMVDVVEQKGDFLPELRAEIAGPRVLLWVLGAVVLLMVAGLFFYRRTKSK